MKINRKIFWFGFLLLASVLNSSCEYSDNRTDNFDSVKENTRVKIDSSLWLKETRGIRDILEDENGNLWFSSPDYIAKFDGRTMSYFSESNGLSITGNIHEDLDGTIWVENGFRIFKYDGVRFSESNLNSITASDELWFQKGLNPADTTYIQPGLYEVNRQTTNFHPIPSPTNTYNKFLYLPSTKAIVSKDGTVWFGTMNKVYGFKNNRFISIGRKEMGRQDDERQIGIRGIFLDSKGVLWMADNGAGVFTYNNGVTENFTKNHLLDAGDVDGNTLHRAFSIAEDSEGNMWFGTVYSGIWMYNPKTDEFSNYSKDDGVMSDNIWTIYKTKDDKLLFAGESPSAVYIFNGETFDRKY
jgi:ligand-binding sensor domain-containing protein